MLHSEPTKHGAGITLYGDYCDLKSLHKTIHELANVAPLSPSLGEFLLGLAYDVRHAYQKDRKIKTFGHDDYDQITYRGVDILWPIFLVQVGTLRWSASFHPTNKEQQSNLFRIEHCAEKSLKEYDLSIGEQCVEWLAFFDGFPTTYLPEFISDITKKYIFGSKGGKQRFKRLPMILRMLHSISKEYQTFEAEMKMLAEEKGYKPEEFHDYAEWSDFKW